MTLELDQLAAHVADVIAAADAGEAVLLTRNGLSSALLQPAVKPGDTVRSFGLGVGLGPFYTAPDFNDPLPDEFWFGGSP